MYNDIGDNMKDNREVREYRDKVVKMTFIIFLLISFISPVTGDDWKNYVIGNSGLLNIFKNVWEMYLTWEGRMASRLFIDLLIPHKLIFSTLFALLIASSTYCICNLMGKVKRKEYYLIPLIALLLVNVNSFAQNYTWKTGCITYTFPALMTILYFAYIFQKKTLYFDLKEIIALSITALLIPMFVENIGLSFVLGNIILTSFYFIKKRKISLPLTGFTIISGVSLIAMLLSPGSALRMETETAFASLNLFEKIGTNIPNFIAHVFTHNFIITLLMTIPINYYLSRVLKGKKIFKNSVIALFNIVPLFNIYCNLHEMIPVNVTLVFKPYNGIFLPSKWYFIFYWIIFITLFILSIFYIIKDQKKKEIVLFFYIITLMSSMAMLLSPVWGERVVFLTILGSILTVSILIEEMHLKLSFKKLHFLLIILMIYYFSIYTFSYYIDRERGNYIKKQMRENSDVIEVIANPFHLVWNYNPDLNGLINKLRLYYDIPKDKEIKFVYRGIFKEIEDKVK